MAGELLMGISQDERERAIFRSRRMYQSDQESNLRTAMYNARNEGRVEGRAEERFTIARNLLIGGDPIEKIAAVTGLTRAEIETIRDAN